MAMFDQAVGFGALRALDVKESFLGLASSSTDATQRIGHDVIARNQAIAQQGHQGNKDARGVATRGGH